MLRPPIFIKTFGNIKFKIWFYPKETLRCLLNGLKSNSNTFNKVTDVVFFRHLFYKDCGGCNCKCKIEDMCYKYSSMAHRQGKVYIPIKIINCDLNSNKVFIGELRSIQEDCKHHSCTPVGVPFAQRGFSECLISFPEEFNNDDKNEIERLKRSYEKIIKELVDNTSSDNCDRNNKNSIDKSGIINLCLKHNISSETIVSLLSELECNNEFEPGRAMKETIPKLCFKCDDNQYRQEKTPPWVSGSRELPHSGLRVKNFKIIPSPTPNSYSSYHSDVLDSCSKSQSKSIPFVGDRSFDRSIPMSMFKSVRSNNCKNSVSDFNNEIKEIKIILNDIISVLSPSDISYNKKIRTPTTDLNEICCEENQSIDAEDLLNVLLQHVSKSKFNSSDHFNSTRTINNFKDSDNCVSLNDISYSAEVPPTFIPVINNTRDQIYRNLPQTIPLINDVNNVSPLSTSTTYGNIIPNQRHPLGFNSPINIDIRDKAKTHSGQDTDIPVNCNELINKLVPLDSSRNGVTNIYYYANSETGQRSPSATEKKEKQDLIIEQQISPKDVSHKDNSQSGYSHIIIDINSQQLNDDKEVTVEKYEYISDSPAELSEHIKKSNKIETQIKNGFILKQ